MKIHAYNMYTYIQCIQCISKSIFGDKSISKMQFSDKFKSIFSLETSTSTVKSHYVDHSTTGQV